MCIYDGQSSASNSEGGSSNQQATGASVGLSAVQLLEEQEEDEDIEDAIEAEENGVFEEEKRSVIENPRRTTLVKTREAAVWPYSTFFASFFKIDILNKKFKVRVPEGLPAALQSWEKDAWKEKSEKEGAAQPEFPAQNTDTKARQSAFYHSSTGALKKHKYILHEYFFWIMYCSDSTKEAPFFRQSYCLSFLEDYYIYILPVILGGLLHLQGQPTW